MSKDKTKKQLSIVYLDFDDISNPLLGAGQARATYQVGTRFVKRGHDVKVICSKFPGYVSRVEGGIKYSHVGIGSKNIRLNNFIYILTLPFVLPKIKADIVVECFTAPISTLFSPLFTSIPVVGLSTSFEAERFAKLYHFPFDKIQNFGLRFYKYFLPSTKYFDLKMKKINSRIISEVVPQGVGEKYLKMNPNANSKHILFLGRLDNGQKGIDLLISAYKKIENEIIYPLIIVGHGPDEKKINSIIKKHGLSKRVRLVGAEFGKKKEKFLKDAIFFAVPSRNEGFCIAALEAIAAGVPIVSFNIPGLSWLSESVSLKSKAFDVDEYSKNMLLATHLKKNKDLRKKCKKVANKYSWEDVSNRYEKFFHFMVKDSRKELD